MNGIESAMRNFKVDTAQTNRVAGDRYINPNNMLCGVFNNRDAYGRDVSSNSYPHETAGCTLPSYRINIENELRPRFSEYYNLRTDGYRNSPALTGETYPIRNHCDSSRNYGNMEQYRQHACSMKKRSGF